MSILNGAREIWDFPANHAIDDSCEHIFVARVNSEPVAVLVLWFRLSSSWT